MHATPQYATPEQEAEWQKKIAVQNRRLLWWIFGLLMLFPLSYLYARMQRENVCEAIVASMGTSWQPGTTIFLEVQDADPSSALISRCNGGPFTVLKASQAVVGNRSLGLRGMPDPLIDPATGRSGVKVSVAGIRWWGPFRVHADVNYGSGGDTYTVVKTLRGWVVTSREMTWIS